MNETSENMDRLQMLLDASAAAAGAHISRILTADRRLNAAAVCERLNGMRLLALATVSSDERPFVGAVDGIFYRGAFHFGSAPDSIRFQHIRRRPDVSATYLPGEELAITVHGRAHFVDIASPDQRGFRQAVLDIYTPRYGPSWEHDFLDAGVSYARIEPAKMFTFDGTGLT